MFTNCSPNLQTRKLIIVLALTAALVAACGGAGPFDLAATDDAPDYAFVIPAGAGEALDRGQPLAILPGSLDVNVGEVIEIENQDDRGHLIGPFFVGPLETVRQEFSSPGQFEGVCTVHPSGQIVVTVS